MLLSLVAVVTPLTSCRFDPCAGWVWGQGRYHERVMQMLGAAGEASDDFTIPMAFWCAFVGGLAVMGVLSLEPVRRRAFHLFYATHQVGF